MTWIKTPQIFLYNYNKYIWLGVTYNSNEYPKKIQSTKNSETHDDLQDDVEGDVHEVTMEHIIQRMRPPIVRAQMSLVVKWVPMSQLVMHFEPIAKIISPKVPPTTPTHKCACIQVLSNIITTITFEPTFVWFPSPNLEQWPPYM